ncbi:MAG TPA: tetratricopeptide repeat protein [Gemmataceae bacterium]|nr:tetratricopeptide repeat protein [Gemmataceae bacterium]
MAWHRGRAPAPQPPAPDLDGVDPAVAAAVEKERQAVLAAPRSAEAWGRLGQVLGAFNYRTEAIACFAEAERLAPREPRWPYFQGILLVLENADEAIPRFRRAAELCGDDPAIVRIRLNETLLTQGRLDEAEAGFRRLLAGEPDNPKAHLGLGRLAFQRERFQDSLPHLRVAAADPRTARAATLALAEVFQRLGDEAAAAQMRQRAEHLPADPPWRDPYAEESKRLHVGKRASLIQADLLFKQRRPDEAIRVLDQLTRDYPDSREPWFFLGQALFRVGDFAGAERAMRKATELAPGFAEAHNYLGACQLRQGKLPEAAAAFRKAIELKPDFALAHSNLGRCLLRQKDTAGALAAFREAVRYKPDHAGAHAELAQLLHEMHHDDEALASARQALQLSPADATAKRLVEKLQPRP